VRRASGRVPVCLGQNLMSSQSGIRGELPSKVGIPDNATNMPVSEGGTARVAGPAVSQRAAKQLRVTARCRGHRNHGQEKNKKTAVERHIWPSTVASQSSKLTSPTLNRMCSMAADEARPLEGACTCGAVRYLMKSKPMFVHCCHCRWCQRETGASFALNAVIEADRVILLKGEPEVVNTPSNSGKGQKIARCPTCHIALWSNYAGAGDAVRFVRVGTLNEPDRLPPDIHIFTASKQPWVVLPPNTPAVDEYYDRAKYWPEESLERRRALIERVRSQ
jgi:hypothetical protein